MSSLFPDETTGELLRKLQEKGDLLKETREIRFAFLFEEDWLARKFQHILAERGFAVSSATAEKNLGKWQVCIVYPAIVPDYETIAALARILVPLANEYLGQFEGIEVELVRGKAR